MKNITLNFSKYIKYVIKIHSNYAAKLLSTIAKVIKKNCEKLRII